MSTYLKITSDYSDAQIKVYENLKKQIKYSIEKEIENGKTEDEVIEITMLKFQKKLMILKHELLRLLKGNDLKEMIMYFDKHGSGDISRANYDWTAQMLIFNDEFDETDGRYIITKNDENRKNRLRNQQWLLDAILTHTDFMKPKPKREPVPIMNTFEMPLIGDFLKVSQLPEVSQQLEELN